MNYLIIIPTYNEAESIELILHRIDAVRKVDKMHQISILVVDDNSPDGTAGLVDRLDISGLQILRREKKSGLGPAYLAGFSWGLARAYDFFVEMDADGSHLPEELPAMLAASANADLVIGSRWVPGGSVINWPKTREFISRFGTWYAATVLRLPYKDLTSGFRVFTRAALETLPFSEIQTRGYGFQIEMAMRIHDRGLQIQEVPITFVERAKGKSKMSFEIVVEAFSKVTQWGFARLINRR
jgi:dolichol-phosphate mannosyltransferase